MEGGSILHTTQVEELVREKRRLVEVPYTATVADTLNLLLAKNILAVPVAAPPGQWIGAGGSMLVESDKVTGAPRKQYIGMVSVLDILIHVAEEDLHEKNRLLISVSNIIGHSLEGLSLWSIAPHTTVYNVLEPMSKGVHRALVPVASTMDHVSGVELVEKSPGYHMLTQTDVMAFLNVHAASLGPIMSASIESLGIINKEGYAALNHMSVMDCVKCMRITRLTAVAIVDASSEVALPSRDLVLGYGKRLQGTFSASDLRGCSSDILTRWSGLSVLDFSHKAFLARRYGFGAVAAASASTLDSSVDEKPLITCTLATPLRDVISKALESRVHQLWVVDDNCCLLGIIAFSDILKAVRGSSI